MHNYSNKFRIEPEFIPRVQNTAKLQTDKLYATTHNPNRKTKNISINIYPNGNKRAQMVKNRRKFNREGITQKRNERNKHFCKKT